MPTVLVEEKQIAAERVHRCKECPNLFEAQDKWICDVAKQNALKVTDCPDTIKQEIDTSLISAVILNNTFKKLNSFFTEVH